MKTCKAEETIRELRATFSNTYDDVTRQLMQLCIDRENNQKELNRLVRLYLARLIENSFSAICSIIIF